MFPFLSPPGPCTSVCVTHQRCVSVPIPLWVWGGVRPWRNHYVADSTSLSFTTKTSISLFVENKNPLSVPYQQDCSLWIARYPGEILKINGLLQRSGWEISRPVSIGKWRISASILLTSLAASRVDEEIDRPRNDLQIHRCVAERPWGHPTAGSAELGHAVPSPPSPVRVSKELGEVVSDDGDTNLRWQRAGVGAGTKTWRPLEACFGEFSSTLD